jgi:oligoribonuclease NrnB/cAMP/cGMP phosphodiesterase (DHH superfamily)
VVSLEGRAERLVEPDALDAFIAAYVAKYAEPDTEGLRAEQMDPFVRQHDTWSVTPERAFGIIERADEFAARATRWRW